jgi:hypothetical protein
MVGRIPYPRPPGFTRKSDINILGLVLGGLGVALLIGSLEFGPFLAGCGIKGEIIFDTHERIYRVPGQDNYWLTQINWVEGERYFCSEMAARAAGWRRASR